MDLFKHLFSAEEIRSGFFRVVEFGVGNDQDLFGFAVAMRKGDRSTDELIRQGRVDIQAEADVDRGIEFRGARFFDEFHGLFEAVDFGSVNLFEGGFVFFAVLFHCSLPPSLLDCDAHLTAGTSDNFLRLFDVVGVEIRHLVFRDLFELSIRDRTNDLFRVAGALFDASRF